MEAGACAEAIVEALVSAASRGVHRALSVRWLRRLRRLPISLRKRLTEAGVILRFYNPVHWRRGLRNFYRDHRKLLLVDKELAVVGGTGVTDEFWRPDHEQQRMA